jgi:hypothetical protein
MNGHANFKEKRLLYSEINQGTGGGPRKTQQKSIFSNEVIKVG